MKLADDVDLEQASYSSQVYFSYYLTAICSRSLPRHTVTLLLMLLLSAQKPPCNKCEKLELINLDEDTIKAEVLDFLGVMMEKF